MKTFWCFPFPWSCKWKEASFINKNFSGQNLPEQKLVCKLNEWFQQNLSVTEEFYDYFMIIHIANFSFSITQILCKYFPVQKNSNITVCLFFPSFSLT